MDFDTRLTFHVILTTRERRPMFDPSDDGWLAMVLRLAAEESRCVPLAVGATHNHVHLVVEMHPDASLSTVVRRMKRLTSREWKETGGSPALRWEKRYWARSVDLHALAWLLPYVNEQRLRHAGHAVRAAWEHGPESVLA